MNKEKKTWENLQGYNKIDIFALIKRSFNEHPRNPFPITYIFSFNVL
jgi:hypothetical protein